LAQSQINIIAYLINVTINKTLQSTVSVVFMNGQRLTFKQYFLDMSLTFIVKHPRGKLLSVQP